MSVDARGFLSPDISRWTKAAREAHRKRFDLIDGISDLGQTVLPMFAGLPRENQNLVTGALFMRGMESLQGAILMLERGMNLAARTLIRGCYETLFYLGASVRDPTFSQRIGADHLVRMEELSRAHSKWSSENDRAQLKTAIEDMKQGRKGRKLRIIDAAQFADMVERYDGFYRGLSTDAAHPSLMSLRSAWDIDGGALKGLQWGPGTVTPEQLDDTLELIALVGLDLIDQTNILLKSENWRKHSSRFLRDIWNFIVPGIRITTSGMLLASSWGTRNFGLTPPYRCPKVAFDSHSGG